MRQDQFLTAWKVFVLCVLICLTSALMTGCSNTAEALNKTLSSADGVCVEVHIEGFLTDSQMDGLIFKAPRDLPEGATFTCPQ